MKSLDDFDDRVWSRFFDFVFPNEEDLSRSQVQTELKQLRIDMRPSQAKLGRVLNQVRESQKARASLESAREKRLPLLKGNNDELP